MKIIKLVKGFTKNNNGAGLWPSGGCEFCVRDRVKDVACWNYSGKEGLTLGFA